MSHQTEIKYDSPDVSITLLLGTRDVAVLFRVPDNEEVVIECEEISSSIDKILTNTLARLGKGNRALLVAIKQLSEEDTEHYNNIVEYEKAMAEQYGEIKSDILPSDVPKLTIHHCA